MRSDEIHPGDIIAGKYRIRAILDRTVGLLVEAFHTEFDQRVIVKLLLPGHGDDKEIERFRREARTLAKLESEHVARILDVGSDVDGSFYLVRQFIDGVDLSSYVGQAGPLPLHEAVLLVLQAAEAVAETHSHGIILRELSPQHMVLTRRPDGAPSVKIVDFGTAKLMRDLAAPRAGMDVTATAMFGLSAYTSPELVRKAKNVDVRTDVFSLGAILYELLAAQPPFVGDMATLMLQITKEEPVPLTHLRTDLPPELDAILGWAMAKDVDARFRDVHAFVAALAPYANAEGALLIDRIARMTSRRPGAVVRLPPISPPARRPAANLEDCETQVLSGPGSPSSGIRRGAMLAESYPPPPSSSPYGPPSSSRGMGVMAHTSFAPIPAPPPSSPAPSSRPGSIPPPSYPGAPPSYPAPPSSRGVPPMSAFAPTLYTTQPTLGPTVASIPPPSVRQLVERKLMLIALAVLAIVMPVFMLVLLLRQRAPEPSTTREEIHVASVTTPEAAPSSVVIAPSRNEPSRPAAVAQATPERSATSAIATPPPSLTPAVTAVAAPQAATPLADVAQSNPVAHNRSQQQSVAPRRAAAPPAAPPPPAAPAPPAPPPETDAAPSAGGTGSLLAIASGGSCTFAVNGSVKGSGSSVKLSLSPGTYTVTCKAPGAIKSKTVSVKNGETAMASFKL